MEVHEAGNNGQVGSTCDILSALPPEVGVGVLAALDSLDDVVLRAGLVCRAWYDLATHPTLVRLWYRRLLRPEPRLPHASWLDNLRGELKECRELSLKRERERISYSHPTMDRFLWAASRGHIQMVKQLWRKAATGVKGRGKGKANSVHKFYLLGDSLVDTSHGLVKGAAYRSEVKRIPLLVACEVGELGVARFLIKKGAPVDAANTEMQTPLMAAAWNGHTDMVAFLLSKAADPGLADLGAKTPLMLAASQGHAPIVQALLTHLGALGKDVKKMVEKKDQDKRTALWWAACNGHAAVVRLLLEHGANPRVKDADKRTPEEAALDEGHEDLVEECFGHQGQGTDQRKKREAQRKRQRRDDDAEYGDAGSEPEGEPRHDRRRLRRTHAVRKEDENEEVKGDDANATTPLRRSRRLRGEKVEARD